MPQKDTMEFWPRAFIKEKMFAWLITNYAPFLLCLAQPRVCPHSTLLLVGIGKEERKSCYFLWAPALWGKNCCLRWRVLSPYFEILKQTPFNSQKDQRALTGSWPLGRDRHLHSFVLRGESQRQDEALQCMTEALSISAVRCDTKTHWKLTMKEIDNEGPD